VISTISPAIEKTSVQPKQKLRLFDFTMIVVSLVIGMGIFRTPANVAAAVPTSFTFLQFG
jgi:hypothetical protein